MFPLNFLNSFRDTKSFVLNLYAEILFLKKKKRGLILIFLQQLFLYKTLYFPIFFGPNVRGVHYIWEVYH